jgi:two-component system sensor histidine kinase YesM
MALNEAGPDVVRMRLKGESYALMAASPTNRFGWRPVFISSDALLRETLDALILSGLRLLLLVLLASLVIALLLTRYYAGPLEKLAAEVAAVRVEDFKGMHLTDRRDEVGTLAKAVDSLMERIRALILDLRESERLKREADLRALRAQINPHFLFNALNSIGHSAALGRGTDAQEMVGALVKLLSAGLDHGAETVRLADELELIKHYIRLLQLSRRDRFSVVYAIAPRTGAAAVPALILQPLVENAVLHGFAGIGRTGRLLIASRFEGADNERRLLIRIEDDGRGLQPSKHSEDDAEAPSDAAGEGIGLRSVIERLSHHYGNRAFFKLQALERGAASVVSISAPEERHA